MARDSEVVELLEIIQKRLGKQGPISDGLDEIAANQSRGNVSLANLAALPELMNQMLVLLAEMRDLLKQDSNAASLGLKAGTVVKK